MASFKERLVNVEYALACDDEANAHYKTTPSRLFRLWISISAFLKTEQSPPCCLFEWWLSHPTFFKIGK